MSMDLEAGRQEEPSFPIGYPSFAAFIASDKDKSTAIYRRFDRLAARNLLQLQDELLHLEARQDALDAAYFHVPKEQKLTVKDWILLKDEANRRPDGQDHERYQIALRIREVLKEYRLLRTVSSRWRAADEIQVKLCSRKRRLWPSRNRHHESLQHLKMNSSMLVRRLAAFQHFLVIVDISSTMKTTCWP